MRTLIAIGSNCGDRAGAVRSAIVYLNNCGTVSATSGIYESPDCIGSGCPYMNAVVELLTELDESELNLRFKALEARMGRTAECRGRGEVPLDVDIVTWGNTIRRPKDFRAAYFIYGYNRL